MIIRQLKIIIFLSVFIAGCNKDKVDLQFFAFGTLELDRISLQAKVAEEITEIVVSEGSKVKKGQVILRLQNSTQQKLVLIATTEAKKAQAYLTQLRNGPREEDISVALAEVEAETTKLTHYEKKVDRNIVLIKKNAINKADFDKVIAIRDNFKADQKAAQEKLNKLKKGTRYEEVIQAEAACEKAYINLAIAQNKLKNYTIKATCNGRLDALLKRTGEHVDVGTNVAVILADGNPYARVYLPEAMRSKITIGSTLSVYVEQIEKTYQGTVRTLALDPAFTSYYIYPKERSYLEYIAEIVLADATGLSVGLPVKVSLPK